MNAVQIPKSKQFKLWGEAARTVTALGNLILVMWNRKTLTRYEHAGHEILKFGAFLHGEFEDGEVIHMKFPKGFKKHFPVGSVLLLKCLYGLKQAAIAF